MNAPIEEIRRMRSRVITYETLEDQIRRALKQDDRVDLNDMLLTAHPANIAAVIDRLEGDARIQIFNQLPAQKAARVLAGLSQEVARQVLADLSDSKIVSLLDQMSMNDAARIVLEAESGRRAGLLETMSPAYARSVRSLLEYPNESIGRLMTGRFVGLQPEMTVAETLDRLRQVDPEIESLSDLYVLDADEQLVGVVSLSDVVTSDPQQRIKDIMTKELFAVTPELDQEEVSRLVSHYDILAVPVVNGSGQMLGIVPTDNIIDVLVSESTEDLLRFGGMEAGAIDRPYFSLSITTIVRKRIFWLLLLFLAETLTGTILRLFESELSQVVALSFFIPLLIGTGGNTGSQTVSNLVRGIATGEVQWQDIWRVIRREIISGFLIGSILGLIAYGRTLLWGNGMEIALVVALTILAICAWANTIGSIIPMIAYKLNIDPAVVSAPLITTLVDTTGLAIYLLIARALLGLA